MLIISSICQSVRLLRFYFGGSTLVRFLAEIKQTPMTSLYFVNRNNAEPTIIGHNLKNKTSENNLSKSTFDTLGPGIVPKHIRQ